MRITTEKQVNVLGWVIVITLFGCAIVNFLINVEVISATVGLVFIGSLCLLDIVRRSAPGQHVLAHLPKLLPDNRFLRWTLLLAGGIVTVDWFLEIGKFLLAQ